MSNSKLGALLDEHVLPYCNPPATAHTSISAAFEQALESSITVKKAIDNLQLPTLERNLQNKLHALQSSAQEDRRGNYEEQSEYMYDIGNMMVATVSKLVRLFFELKAIEAFSTVHKALQMMQRYNLRMLAVDVYEGIEEEGGMDWSVKSPSRGIIYEDGHLNNIFLKVWRDLLLVAISLGGQEAFIKTVLVDLEKASHLPRFSEYIKSGEDAIALDEDDGEMEDEEDSESNGPVYLDNKWHSQSMIGELASYRCDYC